MSSNTLCAVVGGMCCARKESRDEARSPSEVSQLSWRDLCGSEDSAAEGMDVTAPASDAASSGAACSSVAAACDQAPSGAASSLIAAAGDKAASASSSSAAAAAANAAAGNTIPPCAATSSSAGAAVRPPAGGESVPSVVVERVGGADAAQKDGLANTMNVFEVRARHCLAWQLLVGSCVSLVFAIVLACVWL
jgi:hypothetical protein